MAIVNSKAFPYQLDRSIVDMYYDQFTTMDLLWNKIMKKSKAPKGADWSRADLSGLGAALREAGEGEAVEYQVPLEGNKITRYYKKYQLGFQITEEMLEDELFDKMKSMSAGLAKASQFTIEAKVWALFNNAFVTTYSTAKDGKAICADDHASLNGTAIDNKVAADLDTTSLQAAMEFFQSLKSEDDVPITEYLKTLIVPIEEQWKAADLLKSTGRVWDGMTDGGVVAISSTGAPASTNRMNLMNPGMGVVQAWNYLPVRYLTDTDGWFALSGSFDGEVMFKREPKLQSADDVTTGNRLYRTSTRFLPMINEYRYIYGSAGA
jgi:hypothetical protein